MGQGREQYGNEEQASWRRFLGSAAWTAGAIATGSSWLIPASTSWAAPPIKVGIATDLTGALGFEGNANLNVAKMCADVINNSGGLVGRPVQLFVEDTASNGPTPSQQCDRLIPWLIKNGGKRFAFPSANYIWPHILNKYARKLVEANGGEVVFEEYFPIAQIDYGATVNKIMTEKIDVVFNTVIPPGVGPFFKQLYEAGFLKRGGRLCCVYYDENDLSINSAQEIEGLASCLDYFRAVAKLDPDSAKIQSEYDAVFPNTKYLLAAGSAATGMYRGMMLWGKRSSEPARLSGMRLPMRSTTRRCSMHRAAPPKWCRESGTAKCACTSLSQNAENSRS